MKSKILSFLNKLGIPYILRNLKGNGITILCLHRINEENDYFFNPIKPHVFESLIQYCVKHYEVTTFGNITRKTTKPKLILSFDDGYSDFLEYALPILRKYSLPSNHNFVNTCLSNGDIIWTQKLNDVFNFFKNNSIIHDEHINEYGVKFNEDWWSYYISFFYKMLSLKRHERDSVINNLISKYSIVSSYKMMNWSDVSNCLSNYDVEIGSHTYHHESLLKVTEYDELDIEIGKSVYEMENKLKTRINILSLPNGQYNEPVIQYAKEKGIKFVLLGNDKINNPKLLNNNFNLIDRIGLVNEPINEMILRAELFHSRLRK